MENGDYVIELGAGCLQTAIDRNPDGKITEYETKNSKNQIWTVTKNGNSWSIKTKDSDNPSVDKPYLAASNGSVISSKDSFLWNINPITSPEGNGEFSIADTNGNYLFWGSGRTFEIHLQQNFNPAASVFWWTFSPKQGLEGM